MSGDEMRAIVREVLGEVTNGNGHDGNGRRSTSTDDAGVVPQVPAPPVAAVLRPSTWKQPLAPGEVIGNSAPTHATAPAPTPAPTPAPSTRSESLRTAFKDAEFRPNAPPLTTSPPSEIQSPGSTHPGDPRVEVVTIDSDEDLEQFVRQLMSRLENPRERLAIRTGRLRFRLHHSPSPSPSPAPAAANGPVTRVERGAVTERMIRAAATEGARLVLAPGAVLTPLAREQARASGVEIERERRC